MMPIESLESRRLLAVTANLSKSGVLTITGSGQGDSIIVKQTDTQVEIRAGADFAATDRDIVNGKVDITKVKRIVVNAGGGRDYVEAGLFRTRKAIDIVLNGEGANDTLVSQSSRSTLRGGPGNDYLVSVLGNALFRMEAVANRTLDVTRLTTAAVLQSGVLSTFPGVMVSEVRNVLDGGSGDDRLATRGGDDSLYGGDGQDTLLKLNTVDVYFADLAPRPGAGENGATAWASRVAAFGIDKIVDSPNTNYGPVFSVSQDDLLSRWKS